MAVQKAEYKRVSRWARSGKGHKITSRAVVRVQRLAEHKKEVRGA